MKMLEAFEIQAEDLNSWRKVLNSNAYQSLLNTVRRRNRAGYKSPYDVYRGVDLTSIVYSIKT